VAYFEIEDGTKMEEAVTSGKLDIADSFDRARTYWLNKNLPRWVKTSPNLQLTYWSFNSAKPPFDDQRVRRALAMSLDRDYIVANVLSPGLTPAYSFVPPGIANYDTDRPRFYWKSFSREKRLKEAKALLLQAGYGPDNPLTFEFIHRSSGDSPKAATIAKAQWSEIAPWVKVNVSSPKTVVLYARVRQGEFDIADTAWLSDFNDPIGFLQLLDSSETDSKFKLYNNSKFNELLATAADKSDLAQRAQLIARAEKLLLDDVAVSPMWFSSTGNLAAPDLNGWDENPVDVHKSRWMCRVKGLAD
jgi:oligopeptide transport system substrate-binding protein